MPKIIRFGSGVSKTKAKNVHWPRILAHAVFDVQTRRRYLGAVRALACIHRSDACIRRVSADGEFRRGVCTFLKVFS